MEGEAIGSTSAVSAKVNTGTDGSQPDVAIYLIDGNKVANNNADLWDGSIQTNINRTQTDASRSSEVWTGADTNGSAVPNFLGAANSRYGTSFFSDGYWINWDSNANSQNFSFPLYGMSSVLTVPTPAVSVPEPSSLLGFITLGGLMLGSAVRKARK